MGVSIHGWEKVEQVAGCAACGHVPYDESGDDMKIGGSPEFRDRALPFEFGNVVRVSGADASASFSYSGWNFFRSLICQAANREEPEPLWERNERGSSVLWDLIHFTDCDGYLGPIACERIHQELVETRPKFEAFVTTAHRGDTHLVPRYDELTAVFRVASHGGLVRFG